ncbi:MAG: DUF4340 domain-containing protein [Planctomycetes bacterium]|nr:DUF4340 domain-containing protein [Planctomycetota bacterium]
MRFRSTLIMLAIAVVIGGAIIILHYTVPPVKEWDKLAKQMLPLEQKDIVKVEINKDNQQIVCEFNKENNWRITSPIKTPADKVEIENLTYEISSLSKEKGIPVAGNLSEYGLDIPRINLAVTDKKNQTYHLRIGKDAPMNQGVYAMKEGDNNIYIIKPSFWQAISKSLFDLRDKKVISIEPAKIEQIKITLPADSMEFKRKELDEWLTTYPVNENASPEKIRFLLSELENLKAESVVAEQSDTQEDAGKHYAQYGLDKPVLEITVSGANVSETIIWGTIPISDTKKIYATKRGVNPIILVDAASLSNLNIPFKEFRERKLFNIAFENVKSIETKKSGETLVLLEKTGAEWKLTKPSDIPLEWNGPSQLVQKINETEAFDFIADNVSDFGAYGLSSPLLEITVAFLDNQPALTIGISPSMDEKYVYLKKSNETRVVSAGKELFDIVDKGALYLHKKGLLEIPRNKITRCTIVKEDKQIVCEQEKEGVWNILADDKQPIEDTTQLYNILSEICYLGAKEFVANNPSDLSAYGLDYPTCRVEIEYNKDESPAKTTVLIGKKTDKGDFYAMIEGKNIVFILGSNTVSTIDKDVIKKKE